ncbi:MAG: FKBP-type peptidyl-prolyl cis-trans isomerase [Syntrophobacteraceae bacterium]|nr:FKBP-type peptidyl-prolyl cis-trans isomerase [Syntrophobacteraceae bacterium]
MGRLASILFSTFFLFSICQAAQGIPPSTPVDRNSYSLGYTFGRNLRSQGFKLNTDVLLQAVRDGLEAQKPAMSEDDIRETLNKLDETMRIARKSRSENLAAKNREEGKAFLSANKSKKGVKTFPDGLQYRVLVDGKGPVPKANSKVLVNYRGSLLNGALFDSSYTRGKPTAVSVNGVIKGWSEALRHMKTGSKWEIFVPPELAYGPRQFNSIPPESTLIFQIELIKIEKGADPDKHAPVSGMERNQGPKK